MQETIQNQINGFLQSLAETGYSANTIRVYRHALKPIEHLPLNATSAQIMQAIPAEWEPHTAASRQSAIKKFFNWLRETGRLGHNPADGIGGVRLEKKQPVVISHEEQSRIISAINELPLMPRAYFMVLRETGMQSDEVLGINSEDVENCSIDFDGEKKTISLPCAHLLSQIKSEGPLFTTRRSERATYDWAYYWWNKLMGELSMNYTIIQFVRSLAS